MANLTFKRGTRSDAAMVDGMIFFATDTHELLMKQGTSVSVFGAGLSDVSYDEATGVLTITPVAGEAKTVNVGSSKNVNDAITAIQGRLDAVEKAVSDEADARDAAIKALDAEISVEAGKYATGITEVDGVITAVAAKQVEASEVKNESEKAAIKSATNVQAALEALADKISANEVIVVKKTEGVAETSAAEYQLKDASGAVLGADIVIPKDRALIEAYIGSADDTVAEDGTVTKVTADADSQRLNMVYQLANGSFSLVKVDLSKFITETELAAAAGNGLEAEGGKLHVKRDGDSDVYLTVSENGVKLSGVSAAITTVSDAVGAEEARAKAAEDKIEEAIGLKADGSYDKAAEAEANYISTANTVVGAVEKLDAAVKAVENKVDAAAAAADYAKITVNGKEGTATKQGDAYSATLDAADIQLHSSINNLLSENVAATSTLQVVLEKVASDISANKSRDIAADKALADKAGLTYDADATTFTYTAPAAGHAAGSANIAAAVAALNSAMMWQSE